MNKKSFVIPIGLIFLLFTLSLACGSEVSPTKVGEVESIETSPEVEEIEPPEEEPIVEEPMIEEAPQPTDTSSDPLTYEVGDIVSMGDIVMVVLGWDTPPGDEFTQPEEGNKFVVVDILFVNQGLDATNVSSLLQFTLKDTTDQQYDVDLLASLASGENSIDGEISPGERVRGKAGFQVPTDASGLVFVFDADIFGSGKVFVELGPEPVAVEPPSEIIGEVEQPTFSVGDIIEAGEITLTVNEVTFPVGDEFTQPEENKKFVVVDVSFTNNGSESANVSSLLQMEVKDDTGQTYEVDIMASVASGGSTPDGEISSGETIRGQVGYQVPNDAQGLVFVFDADIFGHGKVFVAIPSE
jgi:hypothetical protein